MAKLGGNKTSLNTYPDTSTQLRTSTIRSLGGGVVKEETLKMLNVVISW